MKPIQHFGQPSAAGKLQAASFMIALNELLARRVPVVLTVEEFKEKRSNPQNRYYFGVVVDTIYRALKESGIEVTREGTHELLKFRFLAEDQPIGEGGLFITTIRSTTDLDRMEFGIYLDKCIQFAAEYLNVEIPEAGEQTQMDLAA